MAGLDWHGVAVMLLTLGALVLFSRHRISIEYSCVTILLVLVVGFELFPYESDGQKLGAASFFAGFGNEALVTVVLLLILAKGVEISGALQPLARTLVRLWLHNQSLALLTTLAAAAALSAFVNNTPIVVMLLPLLVGVAHRVRIPPSRVLLPMGFATIVGGMSTTIGTSTNLLVVSVASELGMQRFGMFDFILPAAITAVVAILYLWLVAPALLPDRQPPLNRSSPRLYDSTLEVSDDCPFEGKSFGEVRGLIDKDIRIRRIQRKGLELVRLPLLKIRSGDRFRVSGTAAAIQKLHNLFGGRFEDSDLWRLPDQVLVEVVVTEDSPVFDKRLSEAQVLLLGDLIPTGIFRPGAKAAEGLDATADPVLRSGDILLMQGKRSDIRMLQDRHRLLILDRSIHVPRSSKATLALTIMLGVIAVAAFGWMPIVATALCGVVLMLFSRCLALDEVWAAVDTKLVLVIVTSLALGTALTRTGATAALAMQFVDLVKDLPPAVVVSAVLLLTSLLTEVVSNNAVAVIATPIAFVTAQQLGLPPEPFVLAVLFGANMSYMTPIGYQTNLLVFSTGAYRFSDFFRVGIPLQVLVWLSLSILLPVLYL